MTLRFEESEYCDLDWAKYAVIPKVIRLARLDCAEEDPPLGRQVVLLQ